MHRNTLTFGALALACSSVVTGLAAEEFVVEQKADRLAISHRGKPDVDIFIEIELIRSK